MLDALKKEVLQYAAKYCESDWDKVFAAMQKVYDMGFMGKNEGLLALENGMSTMPKDVQWAILPMLEHFNFERLEDGIVNYFYANSLSGLEAYLFLIYTYGMIYVLQCKSEHEITVLFQSLVPNERCKDVFYNYEDREKRLKRIKKDVSRGKDIAEFTHCFGQEDDFSKAMMAATDDEFKLLLDETSYEDWLSALKDTTKEVVNRFFENKSFSEIFRFADEFNRKDINFDESDKAKQELLETLEEIRLMKERISGGKIDEAFDIGSVSEIASIYDELSKHLIELSDEQIRALLEKTRGFYTYDLQDALTFATPEVRTRFAANMDLNYVFKMFRFSALNKRLAVRRAENIHDIVLEVKMEKPKALFIHGLNGSHDSSTGKVVAETLKNKFDFIIPDFDLLDIKTTLGDIDIIVRSDEISLVVGTSLGAFYALSCAACSKKIAINPCMKPSVEIPKLESALDENVIKDFAKLESKLYGETLSENCAVGLFADNDELFGDKYKALFANCFGEANVLSFEGGHHGSALLQAVEMLKF